MNRTLYTINKLLTAAVVILISTLIAREYFQYRKDMETLGPREYESHANNDRYKLMSIASYNYTDYDIYGVYVLPEDKNDLDYATRGTGSPPARSGQRDWEWHPTAGAIEWDYHWKAPKRFKVWWERVVDKKLFESTTSSYDKYTSKTALPGLAWCEGFITLTRPPSPIETAYVVLHFFPDGRVEGDINGEPRIELSKRNELPKITGKACLKQIPNPFYGKEKPIRFN